MFYVKAKWEYMLLGSNKNQKRQLLKNKLFETEFKSCSKIN